MLWVVEVGESYRCGGETYTIIVQADDEATAENMAAEWGKKIDNSYYVKNVEQLDMQDGIAQVAHEEW